MAYKFKQISSVRGFTGLSLGILEDGTLAVIELLDSDYIEITIPSVCEIEVESEEDDGDTD
jgi:hypothetical protein